jgi:hypothetical protein
MIDKGWHCSFDESIPLMRRVAHPAMPAIAGSRSARMTAPAWRATIEALMLLARA